MESSSSTTTTNGTAHRPHFSIGVDDVYVRPIPGSLVSYMWHAAPNLLYRTGVMCSNDGLLRFLQCGTSSAPQDVFEGKFHINKTLFQKAMFRPRNDLQVGSTCYDEEKDRWCILKRIDMEMGGVHVVYKGQTNQELVSADFLHGLVVVVSQPPTAPHPSAKALAVLQPRRRQQPAQRLSGRKRPSLRQLPLASSVVANTQKSDNQPEQQELQQNHALPPEHNDAPTHQQGDNQTNQSSQERDAATTETLAPQQMATVAAAPPTPPPPVDRQQIRRVSWGELLRIDFDDDDDGFSSDSDSSSSSAGSCSSQDSYFRTPVRSPASSSDEDEDASTDQSHRYRLSVGPITARKTASAAIRATVTGRNLDDAFQEEHLGRTSGDHRAEAENPPPPPQEQQQQPVEATRESSLSVRSNAGANTEFPTQQQEAAARRESSSSQNDSSDDSEAEILTQPQQQNVTRRESSSFDDGRSIVEAEAKIPPLRNQQDDRCNEPSSSNHDSFNIDTETQIQPQPHRQDEARREASSSDNDSINAADAEILTQPHHQEEDWESSSSWDDSNNAEISPHRNHQEIARRESSNSFGGMQSLTVALQLNLESIDSDDVEEEKAIAAVPSMDISDIEEENAIHKHSDDDSSDDSEDDASITMKKKVRASNEPERMDCDADDSDAQSEDKENDSVASSPGNDSSGKATVDSSGEDAPEDDDEEQGSSESSDEEVEPHEAEEVGEIRDEDVFRTPEAGELVSRQWNCEGAYRVGVACGKKKNRKTINIRFFDGWKPNGKPSSQLLQSTIDEASFRLGLFRPRPELKPECRCFDRERNSHCTLKAINRASGSVRVQFDGEEDEEEISPDFLVPC
ncbi:expressed unknown protein [Seminavis robusta]|uniref:Uncharacterized protein n=1 Tax=Seminavis robusta TaxID=568900 RepID=A0A9N8EX95_9STRA|nr:expressed unknown protein [Seminavis robusta]|eukprot:Sro1971_g308560.1 n/a (855) ;mRNA; r:118-2887